MNAKQIISDAAALYGIATADMTSPCRRREMADARAVACHIALLHGITKSEMARRLHRTHAAVLHLTRMAGEWLDQPRLNPRGVDNIEQLLKRYEYEPGTSRGCDTAARGRKAARRGMACVEEEQETRVVSGH